MASKLYPYSEDLHLKQYLSTRLWRMTWSDGMFSNAKEIILRLLGPFR